MNMTTKKQEKENFESTDDQKVKKLSKVGEWLRSGQSFLTITDMRAVLR